jgi:two-component system OmpR family sensor kinase
VEPVTLSARTEGGFTALARRLTGWYVLVAVSSVAVLLLAAAVAGLAIFAHEVNTTITLSQANAKAFAERAQKRHENFQAAAVEFESRDVHEGTHSYAALPRAPRRPGALPSPPVDSVAIIDGTVVRHGTGMRSFFNGNRFGYAIATLFGVRPVPPQPFLEGSISFGPDPQLFQDVTLMLVAAIVIGALAVGLLAFFIGRYITEQAIRPLVDVTEALQRFAARDFRSQAIAVGGRKSDFDVLAIAYNAAAEQVASAFAERDSAEAQMRQFVADAGHELRTPLTIVLGYIDLLYRRVNDDDERSKFIFTSIGAEGRRMRTLVDNLVLLAQLEGEETRPIEPFDVATLIGEIVDVRRGLAKAPAFEVDVPAGILAIADRSDVYEAVANIVDNAAKYAPGSTIRIAVTTPRDGNVEIAISDDGPGIAPEDRAAIFERFFRGAGRGEVEGSGLGLAIAKRAVERAGGTLRLEPPQARGTKFTIALRADRAPAPARVSVPN